MNSLNVSNINLRSPYTVWEESMYSFLKIIFFMLWVLNMMILFGMEPFG